MTEAVKSAQAQHLKEYVDKQRDKHRRLELARIDRLPTQYEREQARTAAYCHFASAAAVGAGGFFLTVAMILVSFKYFGWGGPASLLAAAAASYYWLQVRKERRLKR